MQLVMSPREERKATVKRSVCKPGQGCAQVTKKCWPTSTAHQWPLFSCTSEVSAQRPLKGLLACWKGNRHDSKSLSSKVEDERVQSRNTKEDLGVPRPD